MDGDQHQQVGHANFRSSALGHFVVDESVGSKLFLEEEFQSGGPQIALIFHGVYRFDPLKRKYTATWYTNFNTVAFHRIAGAIPVYGHFC